MIVVVDYGVGNLGSIVNMLKKVGARSKISAERESIMQAEKLILPGVGAYDNGMARLKNTGLIETLVEAVIENRKPLLGICLGAQLLTKGSEEGQHPGLGWLDITTRKFRFPPGSPLKVPHMGWNIAEPAKSSRLFHNLPDPSRFYFVHSYYMQCHDPKDELAKTHHGVEFTSAFERDNIAGVQFHPEKSHKYGMQLMRNFVEEFGGA